MNENDKQAEPVAKAIIGKREVSCHGPNRKYVDGIVIQQLKEIEPETLLYTHPAQPVQDEIARLKAALKKANDQAEHFEREWYLRGDEIEALKAQAVQPAVAQEPVAIASNHWTGAVFVFEGGVLNINKDGSGNIVVQENDFQYLDERCAWVAKFEASEILALRDFLNAKSAPAVAQEPVLQRVMGRLADLLDEDQFAEIEGIVVSVGIAPPPATVQPAAAINEPFYSGFISGEQDWQILKTAVDTWGEYEQVMMAIGECGEFLTLMGRKVQCRLVESDMHDEIADVLIMMHQMANIYGIDHVRARVRHKMEKLAAKLNKTIAAAEAEKAKGVV